MQSVSFTQFCYQLILVTSGVNLRMEEKVFSSDIQQYKFIDFSQPVNNHIEHYLQNKG